MAKLRASYVHRLYHALQLLTDRYLAWDNGVTVPYGMTAYELARLMVVTPSFAREYLRSLEGWGFVDRGKEGKKYVYYISDAGLKWYEEHEGYIDQLAAVSIAITDVNRKAGY